MNKQINKNSSTLCPQTKLQSDFQYQYSIALKTVSSSEFGLRLHNYN